MTIAIDFVGTNTGSGTKTYNINFCNELEASNLKENIIIFICKNYVNQINFGKTKNSKIQYILKPNIFYNIFIRLIWMQLVLPFELKFRGIKKLYSPMNFCPILSRLFKIKVILALHSNLPWVYFNLMPGNLVRNFITKKFMELSITICETLIVDSYFAKNEIANILKLNKDKIKVIYLGIDRKFLSSENSKSFIDNFDYKEKYIVSVLSCVKYHNILNLLKAYKILIKEIDFEIKFVLVLQILDKKYFNTIQSFVKNNFEKNNIILINNIESKNLLNLYKYSQLYVFTSYCEVFGLTSLEAMSQSCPVLISETSALPEINSNAADYFNPDDIIEIKDKIKKNLTDKNFRSNLIKNANIHFKKFSWKDSINKTLEVIDLV
jgi:glycosyltransferase involved in cell wall biosynthesis